MVEISSFRPGAVAALAGLTALVVAAAPVAARPAAPAHAHGSASGPLLDLDPALGSVRARTPGLALDADGTVYAAWLGVTNATPVHDVLHLCALPVGATTCTAMVLDLGTGAKPSGPFVFSPAPGSVEVLYQLDAHPGANAGILRDGALTEVTSVDGGATWSAPQVVGDAATSSQLVAATPNGSTFDTADHGGALGGSTVELRDATNQLAGEWTHVGVTNPRVTFVGANQAVLSTASGATVFVLRQPGLGGWEQVGTQPNVVTGASFDLTGVLGRKRGYYLGTATGADAKRAFGIIGTAGGTAAPKPFGGASNCGHALLSATADEKGRVVVISTPCLSDGNTPGLTITATPDGLHVSATARLVNTSAFHLDAGSPYVPRPAVAARANGRGVVAWEVADANGVDHLLLQRFVVPVVSHVVTKTTPVAKIAVTLPASCLPAQSFGVSAHATPVSGTHLQKLSIKVGGHPLAGGATATVKGTVQGSALPSGASTPVKVTVKTDAGSRTVTVAVTTC